MCGLCGVFGWIGTKEKEALMHLQIFSQLRGMDSSGVSLIPVNNYGKKEIETYTCIGGLETLVLTYDKVFDQRDWTINRFGLSCILGHHRKATYGKVDAEKAHPFDLKNIVGCHNGTIFKHEVQKLDTYDDELIDSEILLRAIDEVGSAKEVLRNINGAWALSWWDKKNKTLNFVRNDQRSLCLAFSDDHKTLFYASEAWMLHTALKRSGIKYNGKVGIVKADRHLTYKEENYKLELVDTEECPGRPLPQTTNLGGSAGAGGGNNNWPPRREGKLTQEGKVVPLVKPSKEQFEEEYAPGFRGEFIPKRRYQKLTEEGCGLCDKEITWEDRKKIRWYNRETPLCIDCQGQFDEELKKAEKRSVH